MVIDFNPRSREGSDITFSEPYVCKPISIHAPARGATKNGRTHNKYLYISIHAPARGATVIGRYISSMASNFNPRSREGSDEGCVKTGHARTDFNPRSREGSDHFTLQMIRTHGNFNPRSREGSDYRREHGEVYMY